MADRDKQEILTKTQKIRRKFYPVARRYWKEVGDEERLALTDEELDEQFWVIDHEA
jgi:hypothetical protein